MLRYIDKASKMYDNMNNDDNYDGGGGGVNVERKCKSRLIQSNDIFVIILLI